MSDSDNTITSDTNLDASTRWREHGRWKGEMPPSGTIIRFSPNLYKEAKIIRSFRDVYLHHFYKDINDAFWAEDAKALPSSVYVVFTPTSPEHIEILAMSLSREEALRMFDVTCKAFYS